ncbi:MAG: ATP-binding cassette domain-containing protein [Bowdeniella nasicola]|nr:ATP-binding cassette domain-containing protein [Bowdeniella nasicola]
MTTRQNVLSVRDLHCHRGRSTTRVEILRGVSLSISRGEVLAVLGANGAGKTTLINVLATLLPLSSGAVQINGYDLVSEPSGVRSSIALTGQYAAIDEELTGRENLVYFGRLNGLGRRAARDRARELLDQFSLDAASDTYVREYSGGMRRRLDIAASLVVPPALLFLDEPTTGLDPLARAGVWTLVRRLGAHGTTILLTTQYLDEADRLADRIALLAGGRVLDSGTPAELKDRYGTSVCEITLTSEAKAAHLCALAQRAGFEARIEGVVTRVGAPHGYRSLTALLRLWDGSEDDIVDAAVKAPTLDDVYRAIADDGDVARPPTTESASI